MNERIYQIMKESGMNQKEFSLATGIATATLSNIFNGRTSATLNHARAIHDKFPKLRIEWLIFGEGDMYDTSEGGVPGVLSPTLFDPAQSEAQPADGRATGEVASSSISVETVLETVKDVARQMERPQRNVVEIRVFFDDGTYDVFSGTRK